MAKTHYEFEGNKLPARFGTAIVLRMFKDDATGMRTFLDKYDSNKHSVGAARKTPSELDRQIAAAYKQTKNYKKAATECKVSYQEAFNSVSRVARYDFLNFLNS